MRIQDIMSSPTVALRRYDSIARARELLEGTGFKQLPVTDEAGVFMGVVNRQLLLLDHTDSTKRVCDVLERTAVTVRDDTPVSCIQKMVLIEGKSPLYVCDAHGRLLGVVTERSLIKALSQAFERQALMLANVLNHMSEGVVVIDKESTIIFANPAYTRILGVPIESVLGKKMREVEPSAKILEVLRTGEPVREEKVYVRSVGKEVIVNIAPIWIDEEVYGAVSVFRDVTETARLMARLQRAELLSKHFEEELQRYQRLPDSFDQIVCESEIMKSVLYIAAQAAPTNATVLITGESGVGKELVARAIHKASARACMPLVKVDCAAIPDNLLESELFGYEEGAFTGAKRGGKPGKVELADGGTLFFDEIGEMPVSMQAKVLRLLQDREIERVGGTRTIKVDVRIIAATNRDLWAMVKNGQFREDLYYRLNVISLEIPPLRKRKEDIPRLCEQFQTEFAEIYRKRVKLSLEVLNVFLAYDWPGNVRELRNVIERCFVLAKDGETVSVHQLPDHIKHRCGLSTGVAKLPQLSLEETLHQTEREVLLRALAECKGNKTMAMKLLGISRRAFYKKLHKHQLLSP